MTTDAELLAIRRAVYADALLRGDPLATANAAARLRAHIGDLGAADLEAMRASRRTFGQAIRQARSRRVSPPLRSSPTHAIPLSRPRGFPVAVAAAVAMLALALVSLIAQPFLVATEGGGGGGGAPIVVAADAVIPIVQSRGRVVLAATTVETAVEVPATTEAPEASAPASPAPTEGANVATGSATPSGSGAPGSGTGTGSGGGNGSGSASPSPAPTATRSPAPSFTICLTSVPRGFARLCGLVVDSVTGRGIAGACVSLGPCSDQSARTDSNGRWTFTLPVGNGTLIWNLEFSKAGYRTALFKQNSRQGFITIPTQRLVAAP